MATTARMDALTAAIESNKGEQQDPSNERTTDEALENYEDDSAGAQQTSAMTSSSSASSSPPPPSSSPSPRSSNRRVSGGGGGAAAFTGRDATVPSRKPEDSFRDEIARQLFGENLGRIRDDYSCAVESKILLHGRMYITDKFVCFYSNFFGFEKKIKIPLCHVLKITKGNTALLIPNGINVVTTRKEYAFRSFWDREDCYLQMVQSFRTYHRMPVASREVILDSRSVDREGRLETPTNSALNSNNGTSIIGTAGMTTTATQSKQQVPSGGRSSSPSPPPSQSSLTPPSTLRSESPPPPSMPPPPIEIPASGAGGDGAGIGSGGGGAGSGSERETEDGQSLGSWDEDDMLDFDFLREGTQNIVSDGDLQAAFAQALQGQQLKQTGLEFRLRHVTVQEFFEDYISDRAPLGQDKYHDSKGDMEIEITPWEEVNQGVGATRNIRFVTNLEGLPVGPPTAPVIQVQRVRVFGQHGMILETSSTMENVPAGDCFTLEDRWVVRPLDPAEEGLHIQTSFEVKFVKSTFFKKIIESRSRADSLSYHQCWFEMIEKHAARKHHDRLPPRRGGLRGSSLERIARRVPGAGKRRGGGSTGSAGGGGGGGEGGEGGEEDAWRRHHGENNGGGVVALLLEQATVLAKRVKWDRFVLAVIVFTCLFYFLRLLLNAILPSSLLSSSSTAPTAVSQVSAAEFQSFLQELQALRVEMQELRGEMRNLNNRMG